MSFSHTVVFPLCLWSIRVFVCLFVCLFSPFVWVLLLISNVNIKDLFVTVCFLLVSSSALAMQPGITDTAGSSHQQQTTAPAVYTFHHSISSISSGGGARDESFGPCTRPHLGNWAQSVCAPGCPSIYACSSSLWF